MAGGVIHLHFHFVLDCECVYTDCLCHRLEWDTSQWNISQLAGGEWAASGTNCNRIWLPSIALWCRSSHATQVWSAEHADGFEQVHC